MGFYRVTHPLVRLCGTDPFMIARLAADTPRRTVIFVGQHDFRLSQVPEAICIHEPRTADVRQAVLQANAGAGVDVAILAVASQSALDLCLASLRARGRLVVFSPIPGRASLDLFRLHTQELEILGSCNDDDLINLASARLGDPHLRAASLVTHRWPFAQWLRAFELARDRKDEALKVALTFGEDK